MSNPNSFLSENRFKRLRTPANVFIINLTICDFFACCLHPLAVYSAFRGRWSFGQTGKIFCRMSNCQIEFLKPMKCLLFFPVK
jgi:hypothetical protein